MNKAFSLSLIVPAYNEEEGIEYAIKSNLATLRKEGLDFEIIIINDGSIDGTKQIIEQHFAGLSEVKFESKPNGGFGSAIRKGVTLAAKSHIIFAPVDCPLSPATLSSFLSNHDKADILVSYRRERKGYNWRMKLNSKVYNLMVSLLFGFSLKDFNWIHMYPKKMFDSDITIEYDGIFMPAEVLIKAHKQGYSFHEFPVDMEKRTTGKATAQSLKAIVQTFRDLIKFFVNR
ncbi:MAG: glycosyltransferase family 2 protein [Flavobacteriales bacterium]|nr:glycosyltransferase family 2 protein [Flavobacteriales bacterium]